MNIFTQFFKKSQNDQISLEASIRNDLIRRESRIGRTIFGPISKGHNREFFRIDKQTWIWQETWKQDGSTHHKDTKYLIRDREILKSVNGNSYHRVSLEEAENLDAAINTYVSRVKSEIYRSPVSL